MCMGAWLRVCGFPAVIKIVGWNGAFWVDPHLAEENVPHWEDGPLKQLQLSYRCQTKEKKRNAHNLCSTATTDRHTYSEYIPKVYQIKFCMPPVMLIASKHFLSSWDVLLRQQLAHVDMHQLCWSFWSDLHFLLSACLQHSNNSVKSATHSHWYISANGPLTCFMIWLSMKGVPQWSEAASQ